MAWDQSCRWAEWQLVWDGRRGAPCTDPPHSPQPSRLPLRLPRQILLTALTCTARDQGLWYRAWLCEDVVEPVRALPSRDFTLLLPRISGLQGRFLIARVFPLVKTRTRFVRECKRIANPELPWQRQRGLRLTRKCKFCWD